MKKGILFALLTALVSGASIYLNKFGVGMSNPFVFTFLKNVAVSVLLLSTLVLAREFGSLVNLKRKDYLNLALVGLVGGSIPFLLFFRGLQLTSASKGSFIHKTMFIYVALFAYLFLKERFDKRFFVATAALIAGNLLLLKLDWQPFNIGDAMVLAAAVLWAAENTLSKHLLKDIPANVLAFSRMFFGSAFILMFLIFTGQATEIFLLTGQQILWTGVTSAFLFLYVVLWYAGLKELPVTLATSMLLLGSPVTTMLSIANGVMPSIQQAAGMFAILAGIIVLLNTYISGTPSPADA